jgi:ketosteroid isomerase-like protein
MSPENVAIMREAYAAFDRGEANVLFELLDPEIEWRSLEDTEPKHGTDGVLESVTGWFGVWDDFQIEPEEFIDGGDHVIAVVMERGRVPGSDEVVSQRFFQVWTLVDGKIRAFREYKSQREALAAGGLSEHDVHAGS